MNIVYLSNKPVYPLVDGGCLAMGKFLQLLTSGDCTVKHFCIETHKHPFNPNDYPLSLREKLQIESFFVNTKVKILDALSALLKNKSYNIQRFKCSELNKQLSSYLNQNQIDLVILESIYLSDVYQVIRDNSKAKIIIRTHNVEFNLWERLASNQGNGFKKFYLNKLAKTLQKEELELLNKVDGVMCITDSDKKLLLSNGINKPLITVPVSIETVDSEPNYEIAQFYHLGTMNWEPNIEAVHHLIYEIFPKIKAKRPYAKLCIAGSNMTNKMKNLKIDGVEFIGFVPSIPQFLNQAGILLSPIQSGSGVRVKLLESMGSGIPIVTTELGKEGINIENGKELFFTDNDETFIEYAIELFDSESLRRKIGIQAKQHIRKEYLIENIKKQAFEFIQNIS